MILENRPAPTRFKSASYIQVNIYGRTLETLNEQGVKLSSLLESAGCGLNHVMEVPIAFSGNDSESAFCTRKNFTVTDENIMVPRCSTGIFPHKHVSLNAPHELSSIFPEKNSEHIYNETAEASNESFFSAISEGLTFARCPAEHKLDIDKELSNSVNETEAEDGGETEHANFPRNNPPTKRSCTEPAARNKGKTLNKTSSCMAVVPSLNVFEKDLSTITEHFISNDGHDDLKKRPLRRRTLSHTSHNLEINPRKTASCVAFLSTLAKSFDELGVIGTADGDETIDFQEARKPKQFLRRQPARRCTLPKETVLPIVKTNSCVVVNLGRSYQQLSGGDKKPTRRAKKGVSRAASYMTLRTRLPTQLISKSASVGKIDLSMETQRVDQLLQKNQPEMFSADEYEENESQWVFDPSIENDQDFSTAREIAKMFQIESKRAEEDIEQTTSAKPSVLKYKSSQKEFTELQPLSMSSPEDSQSYSMLVHRLNVASSGPLMYPLTNTTNAANPLNAFGAVDPSFGRLPNKNEALTSETPNEDQLEEEEFYEENESECHSFGDGNQLQSTTEKAELSMHPSIRIQKRNTRTATQSSFNKVRKRVNYRPKGNNNNNKNELHHIVCCFNDCKTNINWRVKYGKMKLLNHALLHAVSEHIECKLCDYQSKNSNRMWWHYRKVHPGVKSFGYSMKEIPMGEDDMAKLWNECYKDYMPVVGELRVTRKMALKSNDN